MKIHEIMTKEVEVTNPQTSLREAAKRMASLDVGILPVCDGDRLVGMLTDRDMTIRAVARGLLPDNAHVEEVMTPDVAYCFEDQEAEEAGRIMEQHQIRRLPVLTREKRLSGILSLGDLATKSNDGCAGEALEKISQPS